MNQKTKRVLRTAVLAAAFIGLTMITAGSNSDGANAQRAAWTKEETVIGNQIDKLRGLADDVRARATKQLALDIRRLEKTPHKLGLASALANLSTEGDFGRETLQEVTTTLAEALREQPPSMNGDEPGSPYLQLAALARYENMKVSLDNPQFAAAMARLAKDDESRQGVDFTLSDVQGTAWTLKSLRGKVVLVNFWATWCPPCRKEMPDLDALYHRFKDKGFVILAISDEEADKVKTYLAEHKVTYPMLLDPGRKVYDVFRIDGIPKSFVFDREGKLVAQAIDMRTQRQFLEMLERAGLR